MIGPTQTGNSDGIETVQMSRRMTTLKTIHFALVAGVLMFSGVVILQSYGKMTFAPAFQNPMVFVAAIVTASGIGVSFLIAGLFAKASPMPADGAAAIQKYQTLCLVRAATIEGPALFSAVVTLITANILPAGLLVLCVVTLIIHCPSEGEFKRLTSQRISQQRD
ncbi:MAG: hypothetical protein WCN95_07555 [bacterium]